jgi:quinol monooxygenase YgiN
LVSRIIIPSLKEQAMSYVVVARWRPREAETEKIQSILLELAAAVRREPGNLQFTVHRRRDDTNEFLLYEVYKSEQAFREHQDTEHFKRLVLERAVPLLSVRERAAYAIVNGDPV